MNQLGIVKNIVEVAGMDVSYTYEDLVFLDHNSYLLQFTEQEQELLVHVNSEADRETVGQDIIRLQEIALGQNMKFVRGDQYTLSEADGETITIEFSGS